MKAFAITVVLLLLTGCAGVGLVATSDPKEKLQQADYLMMQDRPALAELTIKDAMRIFQEKGDELGMADAYHAYGNLYKDDSYHGKWAAFFKKEGTYDGTYMKSIENFNKAMVLFQKHSEESGVVKCLLGIGNAYGLRNEKAKSCEYYRQSLSRYDKAKKEGNLKVEPVMHDKRYKNMGELIEAFIKNYCETK